jgi:hypothetical protein
MMTRSVPKPVAKTQPAFNVPLGVALQGSEPLVSLMQRLRLSQARFATTCALLPPGLRAAVQPGTLDDAGWTLLVSNAAAAAKLRQLLPQIHAALKAQGWNDAEVRLKLLSSR